MKSQLYLYSLIFIDGFRDKYADDFVEEYANGVIGTHMLMTS